MSAAATTTAVAMYISVPMHAPVFGTGKGESAVVGV